MKITVILCVALAACAAPAVAPTKLRNGAAGFVTSCFGNTSGWGECFTRAGRQCPQGFVEVERESAVADGFIHRNLTFHCK